MNSNLVKCFVFLVANFGLTCRGAAPAADSGVADVPLRETLKALWESIDTLAFTSEEYALDERGRPDPAVRGVIVFEFAMGSGGRRALTSRSPGTPGRIFECVKQDGRRRYTIASGVDSPDRVTIEPQADSPDEFTGQMCQALWLLTPGGKPLHAHLAAGATLETVAAPDSSTRPVLVANHRGTVMRCELDPQHDWLPVRVLTEGFSDARVTRFAEHQGRWFPAEGTLEYLFDTKNKHSGFRVTSLSFNRPLPAGTFNPLPPPDGTLIDDRSIGKTRVQGGKAALVRRQLAKQSQPATESVGRSVIGSRDPGGFPWGTVLGGLGSCLLIVLGVLTIRRRRLG